MKLRKKGTMNTLSDVYDNYDNKFNLSKKEFIEICRTFNSLLMRTIIETGYAYKLPHRLGALSVGKRKTQKAKIDFGHYQRTGEIIKFKNKHSEGYYATFRWEKNFPVGIFTNKEIFKFFGSRYYKKYLYEAIVERNTMNKYFEYV